MKKYSYEIFQINKPEGFVFMPWKFAKEHGFCFRPYKKVWGDEEEAIDKCWNYEMDMHICNNPVLFNYLSDESEKHFSLGTKEDVEIVLSNENIYDHID